ncbi:WD40 repeat domain-containing protein [Herbidospora sp. RD11066]
MKTRAFVAAAITALAVMSPATVAEARTGAASAPARYVWLKSCPKQDYTVPCGQWMITRRDGTTTPLADAQVHRVTASGGVDTESALQPALSGDGRKLAYFTAKTKKLVIRDLTTGKVAPLKGAAAKLPKGITVNDVDTLLSNDGKHLAIDYIDADGKLLTKIVEVASGRYYTLPIGTALQGFSGDGSAVMVTSVSDQNTTLFTSIDADGELNSQEVPQVVDDNYPLALADDGRGIAVFIEGRQSAVRVYDLSTDSVGPPVRVTLPKGERANRLAWETSERLLLWTYRNTSEATVIGGGLRSIDIRTGEIRKIDTWTLKSNLWIWWLPGE